MKSRFLEFLPGLFNEDFYLFRGPRLRLAVLGLDEHNKAFETCQHLLLMVSPVLLQQRLLRPVADRILVHLFVDGSEAKGVDGVDTLAHLITGTIGHLASFPEDKLF